MVKRVTSSTVAPTSQIAAELASEPVGQGMRASTAEPAFTDGILPTPQPAKSFGMFFGGQSQWWQLNIDTTTSTGKPGVAMAEAGKPFVVNYERGLQDLGATGNLASVMLHYQINNGDVQSLPITSGARNMANGQLVRFPATIPIPQNARGELVYWLELTATDGSKVWDSDFGKNYRTTLVPAGGTMVRFDEQWSAQTNTPIKAGEALRIAYDVDRLKQFLRGTNVRGAETWHITAYVAFDDKPAQEFEVTVPQFGPSGTYHALVPWEVAVAVPTDARKASIWFMGSAYGGSVFGGNAYDSNFGKNWEFPVEPAQWIPA